MYYNPKSVPNRIRDAFLGIVLVVLIVLLIITVSSLISDAMAPDPVPIEETFTVTIAKIDAVNTKYYNDVDFIAGVVSEEFSGPVQITNEQYVKLKIDNTVTVHRVTTDGSVDYIYIEEFNSENIEFAPIR